MEHQDKNYWPFVNVNIGISSADSYENFIIKITRLRQPTYFAINGQSNKNRIRTMRLKAFLISLNHDQKEGLDQEGKVSVVLSITILFICFFYNTFFYSAHTSYSPSVHGEKNQVISCHHWDYINENYIQIRKKSTTAN